jgi:beta-lactamase class A
MRVITRAIVASCALLVAGGAAAQPVAPTGGPGGGREAGNEAEPRAVFRASFERDLARIADGVDGVMAFTIVDLESGERFERLADRLFPTASTIKIAILYELFRQAEAGRVPLDEPLALAPTARAAGSGILQFLEAPRLTLRDYAALMIMLSDNTATNVLIDTLGMARINETVAALPDVGAGGVRLQRRMMDADAAARGDENLATPRALAALLQAIAGGTGISAESRATMLEILRLPKSTALTRGLPAGVRAASKPGGLEGVAVDAGYVEVAGRGYILVAMTSWLKASQDGDRAIEALSRATYEYVRRAAQGGAHGRLLDRR